MSPATPEKSYTAQDLLVLNGDLVYELIDGKLVEKPVGAKASRVAMNVVRNLDNFALANHLGLVYPPDTGHQIWPDKPNRVRKPDGSFYRSGRLPDDTSPQGWLRVAPDWALEVVSPNDLAEDIDARVAEYLQAGVRLIWVVYPETRRVHVFRADGSAAYLTENDQLSGEDVLPGFTCRVADFFHPV